MKVIITGVTGFVGTNLSVFFKDKEVHVEALSLRNSENIKSLSNDAQAIIHLAGKAHDTSNTSSSDEYFKVNRDLTIQLFNEFLKNDIRDFFYFSSVKAVADTVDGILEEEVISKPITPYGKSKIEAEEYLLSQILPKGKRLFIIRPCMIHGPANKGNLNLLYKVIEKGIPWPLAAFHNQRSFLSIDNLNFIILEMLNNENIDSGVFNVADDDFVSTNELITIISGSLGLKGKLLKINKGFIQGLAKVGDLVKLPLNTERLNKLTENYRVSNHKIKSALGIDKLPLTAQEGLIKTIESFKNK